MLAHAGRMHGASGNTPHLALTPTMKVEAVATRANVQALERRRKMGYGWEKVCKTNRLAATHYLGISAI